jgi:hypothetical protein
VGRQNCVRQDNQAFNASARITPWYTSGPTIRVLIGIVNCLGVLYCFFVIVHGRRKILHPNVTDHPTGQWIVQKLIKAIARTTVSTEDTPATRAVAPEPTASARLVAHPRSGGLHHRYDWHQAA